MIYRAFSIEKERQLLALPSWRSFLRKWRSRNPWPKIGFTGDVMRNCGPHLIHESRDVSYEQAASIEKLPMRCLLKAVS